MKKRILSFLLALVMVAGLLPAAALTAFAAQYTVVGVSVQSDGVVCDDGWYYLDDPSIHLLYSDNSSMFASSVSPLYTDEECLDNLTSAPVLGEKYYFKVFAYAYNDTDYSATTSKSSIDVEGFCSGRVEDAYKDGAVYIVTCSIIYGELTGGVKAVASGVEYDSAKGGYAPNFTTLKAVSTEGKELEHIVLDGNYHYYGATAGLLYKNRSYSTFSDKLTTEPQDGETYYSYIRLNSIDGNLNIEEDLVDIQIPGYDVQYLASYESDMGFTSMVVYSVTKKSPDVYVGGVGMFSGDYLAVGATKTQTTKPSGGYAYYKDGKLTLNNYSYEGGGYGFGTVYTNCTNLTIELLGDNTLVQTKSGRDAICADGANLTIGGTGNLTCRGGDHGIWVGGGLTINGGTITAIGNTRAICYSGSKGFSVADGLTIQASTTVNGALGEYVAANHDSYKKITIHSHNFGTAWKYKEADGHAHVCSFCGEHDTVIKHTPDISAPTENQAQKCTVCGYVIAPSLGHIHKNNLTKVTAKPATCTSDGNSEYYSCSCGKYFKDASASTEIKDKNSVIIKASHSFGTDWGYQDENGHAHACVCGTHDELIPHTPGAEATETTPQKCTECAYIITPALNHVHNLMKISARPATCTEEGNAEFYMCDGCSDWFEDAEGNVKIEDKASVKLVATGHAFGDEFKSDENEHWYECACGEKKDVDAHNDENDDGKCDACGYSSAPAETEPAVTTPSDNTETTAPDKTDDENKGGMPWWAILLIVVAVAGISVGVTVIVLKKKK